HITRRRPNTSPDVVAHMRWIRGRRCAPVDHRFIANDARRAVTVHNSERANEPGCAEQSNAEPDLKFHWTRHAGRKPRARDEQETHEETDSDRTEINDGVTGTRQQHRIHEHGDDRQYEAAEQA